MLMAQTAVELRLTLRRGESVLVTVVFPVLLLLFFGTVPILPVVAGEGPVATLYPGILALAVMSSAMVSLGIATAFERQYGVLKRLGGSPLPRPALLGAKILSVLAVEALQVVLLTSTAVLLGWPPSGAAPGAPRLLLAAIGLLLGTAAFGGLGLWMAGSWRAEAALAGANGLYLVLLLLGGLLVPVDRLPGPLAPLAAVLPSAALAGVLRAALTGPSVPGPGGPGTLVTELLVLGLWAVLAPALAAFTFKWE
jgi:ABC-2 type transport system permease protein